MTTKVFVYGTLKKGFPNHFFLNAKEHGTATYICNAVTKDKYPLVIDADQGNLPFLLYLSGNGYVGLYILLLTDSMKFAALIG